MNSSITAWALRWRVPVDALQELHTIFGIPQGSMAFSRIDETTSETYVQNLVRLEAARKGLKLWRNNVGVMQEQNGQPVRFGLANDSKILNQTVKSGDLIGWRPLIIGPQHIGTKVAQFVSRECKRTAWRYAGTDREVAQLKWAQVVNADGGDACFATGEGTL